METSGLEKRRRRAVSLGSESEFAERFLRSWEDGFAEMELEVVQLRMEKKGDLLCLLDLNL